MPENDVATTLSELERKLRELEDELETPAAPPPAARPVEASPTEAWRSTGPVLAQAPVTAPAPAPTFAPAPPEPSAPAGPSAQEQLDELLLFRTELERSAQELMAEYERVLASLQVTASTPSPTPASAPLTPVVPVSVPPVPLVSAMEPAGMPPEPWQPAPVASLDDTVIDGAITVDAGPFTDIGSLSGFEQALAVVPGVRDVYVRGFEGNRAMIDVTLGQPVALGAELRRVCPISFTITAVDAGRLSVSVQGA